MDSNPARESIIRQLLRSAVSNYVGRFINVGVWLLLTPFILDRLDSTLYGLWMLVGSVMAYGSLLDLGISGAITKYVAEYRAKGHFREAQELLSTSLVIYVVLGSIAFAISLIIAPLFSRIFNVPPWYHSTAMWLVILAGFGTAVAIPSNSTTAVLRGLQRFDILNLMGVISTLLLAGSMVAVLLLGGSVIAIAATGVTVNLVMLVPTIWAIHRIAPDLRFGLVGGSRQMLRTVTSYSSSMFMLRIGGQLETETDEIVIGASLPVSSVTPYNLARRLSALPQMLTEQFLTLLLPLASKLHAENDQARLRSLYIISTRLTLAIFLPVGVSLIFLAGPFLTVWVGPAFAGYAPLVLILCLASMIDTSTWPAGSVLQGMGLPRFSGAVSIMSGVSNLILSLVLVKKIGLTGVALGTLLPTCIFCLGFVHPYVIRKLRVPFGEVFRQVILPPLIPVVPAGVGIYIVSRMLALTSVLSILLVGASGALIYLAVYLRLGANEVERAILRKVWIEIAQRAKSYANAS